MKKIILLITLLASQYGHALPVGFNQAWFEKGYGLQYLDRFYKEQEVNRIFKLAKDAGSKEIRLWFFESASFPMIKWKKGEMVGVRDDFIKNVIKTLQAAKNHDLKIYMTLLDAHVYHPIKLSDASLKKIWNVYQAEGGAEFLSKAVRPLLQAIGEAGLSSTISKIDLANEADTIVKRKGFTQGWKSASRMLCQWRQSIHEVEAFKNTPVSFSIRLHQLIFLPRNFLADDGPMACADFIDFHSYANSGKIYKCDHLKAYSESNKKKLILGEFGQNYFTNRYSDALQVQNTKNYIQSAKECGFSEAFAWRLSDIRNGFNKEARYSYEAYGKTRPAYDLIKAENAGL